MLDIVLVTGLALSVALFYAVWISRPLQNPERPQASQASISVALLIGHLLSGVLHFNLRLDPTALVDEGLTSQNRLQVLAVFAVALWAAHLIGSRRIKPSLLLRGPGGWIAALLSMYLLSTAWAVWPALTGLRAIELTAVWIVASHAFQPGQRRSGVLIYLTCATIAYATQAVLGQGLSLSLLNRAGMASNSASAIAAILLLVWLLRQDHPRVALYTILAVGALYFFGSLASIAALLGGLCVFGAVVLRASRLGPVLMIGGAALAVLAATAPVLTDTGDVNPTVAVLLNKDAEHLESWTGRLPLWHMSVQLIMNEPIGYGLGSDRLLSTHLQGTTTAAGWDARNVHNGFMAAALSGGVISLALLFCAFLATGRTAMARGRDPAERAVWLGLLTLVAVNNLTVVGVGGIAHPLFSIFVALAYYGPDAFGDERRPSWRLSRKTEHKVVPSTREGLAARKFRSL